MIGLLGMPVGCPHNLSNLKNRGNKKTSMDKKGGKCTYTITGKEPVSGRVMNTILNGMLRECRGQLQVQCKYQKLKKVVTSSKELGIGSAMSQVGSTSETKNLDDDQKDKRLRKGQRGRPSKPKNEKKGNNGNNKKNDNETTLKKAVVIKTAKSKNNNTTNSATPAFTRQKARIQKAQNNDDDAVTSEINLDDNEVDDDTFLEELFNTSMESLETSEDSEEESVQ